MYIVKLINGDITTSIHGHKDKLKSGNIVKGINSIDSFSFTLLKSNPGFNKVFDFSTLVTVYNTNKKRYDFLGRVLYSSTSMDENGMITKEVTCESYFGYLCDSQQPYVEATNWTVKGLLQHIIDRHNEQVEDYKKFTIGTVTVTDPNDNVYIGIQRENTWDTIRTKLIEKLGGEIRFRAEGDVLYLDYLTEIGETRLTEIALSRNMKAITKENNPSDYVTRLIPLGSKIKVTGEDGEETESEQRVDITSVNDGKNYIDNADGIELYGIHVGYVFFDDVTVPNNLLQKGREYLIANSKVQVKYSVSALDLSLLGLDIDDFDVHNRHPIKNPLIGIDDTARIIKKNVDVCEEIKSTIEIGDSFKTLSEIQREQIQNLKDTIDKIKYDTSDIKGKISVTQKDVNKLNTKIEGIDGTYPTFSISENGYWIINGEETDTKAQGETPEITVGANGNWFVDGEDTNTKAQGEQGKDGADIEYVYYRSQNAVANLATPKYTGTTLSSDWTTSPQGITETYKYEYASVRKKTAGSTTWGAFSTPFIWSKWGEQGIQGDPGEGISTVTNYYLASASASGVTTSTTGWNTDVSTQTLTATKKYLWNYEKITYTGSKTPTTTTPCIIGVFGKDGKGISSITEYYLASSSASGVTTSTTGWDTKPQTTDTSKKYLWNYEKIIYTDGSEGTTDPIIIGVHGATGASATAYSMITSSSVIAKSTSGTLSPSSITLSGKSKTGTNSPVDYACRFKIETTTDMSNWTAPYTSTSNVSSYTYTVPSGIKALRCSMYLAGGTSTLLDQQVIPVVSDGTNGNDAYTVILSNESHTFAEGTSSIVSPYIIAYKGTTQIATKVTKIGSTSVSGTQTVTPITGLSFTTYNNGGSSTSNFVQVDASTSLITESGTVPFTIQADGKTFTKDFSFSVARKGADGAGISTVTNYYLASASASGVTTSTTGWNTNVSTQTLDATKKYLWNYEKITYTGGKSETTTTPCIIGVFGKDGVGISSITEYYLASSSASGVTTSTSGWSTNVSTQTLDATKKYLWNYEKITYTGGKSETTTDPCIIGVFGADGRTQYWHIKYSDDGGKTLTGSNGEEIGMWIGTYVDFNETDSTDLSKYTWKKFEEVEKLTVVTESHTTDIERTEENVSLIASKSYVETSALEEYKEEVDAEFDVRAEGIDMKFTTTTKQIEDVDGDLQSKFAKVYKHIAFNDNGITIGSGDSAIELVIDNETGIVFKKNGVQFGWWDGTNFHTGNIVIAVTERAQFGDYAFVPRSDGSLSFLKVGGTGVQEGTLSGGSDE